MTPQARAGIFRAADGNADGVVTKAEYVLNRIITDEAKAIVQGMDDDKDGSVERAEFVRHAAKLLADPELAAQVYEAFDANTDGSITIPEYLRVWGQWARVGRKPAEERIAARRAEFAAVESKPDKKAAHPPKGQPGGGPLSGRPGAGAGPPSSEAMFSRFDRNGDGKLTESEVPAPLWKRLSNMDADNDGAITPAEFGRNRNRRPPADPPMGEHSGGQTPSTGPKGIEPAPADCPACAMGLTAEFVFKRLDVNVDGKIDVEEFEKTPGMRGEAQAREAVAKIDTSGDGVLAWEEFKKAYRIRHADCKKTPSEGKEARDPITDPERRGDGNRFARVFILRSDQDGDGQIDKKEFRGSDSGFERLDKNGNGFIEPGELNELHQKRLADPKTM
jgi:Ca2+-binding EF-hand superfamily protein